MNCIAAIIACLLALSARTRADGYGAEVYAPNHASVDYYTYPSYAFEYAVRDPKTGDNKAQWEKRDGDVVRGAYSLVEPDGSIRVVEYKADDKSGFNAVVKRIGPNLHPVSVPLYKAPLPVIGYKSEAPISIGPVAGIEKLASAPLLNGDYGGGLASSYSSLYKTPVVVKEVIKEPIVPLPIIKEPIVPYPIIKEPIVPYQNIKEPYFPIYKQPIYSTPIIKEPIIKESLFKSIYPEPYQYVGPINKQPYYGPIYKQPYGPIYKTPVLSGLYNGGYDLGLLGKGLLGDKGLGLYDYKVLADKGLYDYKGLGLDYYKGYSDKGYGL